MARVMDRNHETPKRSRLVQVEGALDAIRKYVLGRMEDLHSEMARRIEDRRGTIEEIFSNLEAVDPRSGKVLTLAQFEEYVRLQGQLMDTLREISVSKEIQKEFVSMLTDSRKFFAPPCGIYRFAVRHQERPPLNHESRQLYRCTRMQFCLEATKKYVLRRMESEVHRGKKAVELILPELIEGARLESMDIGQFEEYIAGYRRLIGKTKQLYDAVVKARAEFEAMLRDSREMVVPRGGKYHKFVVEPFREKEREIEEPECPKLYRIGSYILVALTFVASVIVF